MTQHFLRIDDIGLWEYQEACINELLDACVSTGHKIVLGVIAGQLEQKTTDYFKDFVQKNPDTVEFALHGVTHDLQEFTPDKTIDQQLATLEEGKRLIKAKLGVVVNAFIPPEHILSETTYPALERSGIQVLSKQFKPTLDGKLFYGLARLLRFRFLLGKKASFHPSDVPASSMKEISIAIEVAERFKIKDADRLKEEYRNAKKYTDVVGFLIHPQVLAVQAEMEKFVAFMQLMNTENISFKSLADITRQAAGR